MRSKRWTPQVQRLVREEQAKDKKSSPGWRGQASQRICDPVAPLKQVSARVQESGDASPAAGWYLSYRATT